MGLTRKLAVIVVELTTTTLLTLAAPPWTVTVAGDVKLVPLSVTFTVALRAAAFTVRADRAGESPMILGEAPASP